MRNPVLENSALGAPAVLSPEEHPSPHHSLERHIAARQSNHSSSGDTIHPRVEDRQNSYGSSARSSFSSQVSGMSGPTSFGRARTPSPPLPPLSHHSMQPPQPQHAHMQQPPPPPPHHMQAQQMYLKQRAQRPDAIEMTNRGAPHAVYVDTIPNRGMPLPPSQQQQQQQQQHQQQQQQAPPPRLPPVTDLQLPPSNPMMWDVRLPELRPAQQGPPPVIPILLAPQQQQQDLQQQQQQHHHHQQQQQQRQAQMHLSAPPGFTAPAGYHRRGSMPDLSVPGMHSDLSGSAAVGMGQSQQHLQPQPQQQQSQSQPASQQGRRTSYDRRTISAGEESDSGISADGGRGSGGAQAATHAGGDEFGSKEEKLAHKRRMNAEAARRCRERKAQRIQHLEEQVATLEQTNATLVSRTAMLNSARRSWEACEHQLTAQCDALRARCSELDAQLHDARLGLLFKAADMQRNGHGAAAAGGEVPRVGDGKGVSDVVAMPPPAAPGAEPNAAYHQHAGSRDYDSSAAAAAAAVEPKTKRLRLDSQ
ncbi:hypothetical protein HDU88_002972 [Geranomyces variabilis]|nr:hypothetical protein HDU88_002972 [Geranomyces variabilis]